MDEKFVEVAEATQEAVLEQAVRQRRAAAFPDEEVPVGQQTTHCLEDDCGVELPELRVKRGQERCVECQTAVEKRQKRGY